MKTLDRYVVTNFLISYLIMAFVMIGLYVLVDLTLNSDEFTEHDESAMSVLGDIGTYYGNQVFVYFKELGGIITLMSAIVTLTMMNRRNEMTAILASGVSLYRVIWPVLILGLAFNGLAILDQELIIPRIADKLVRSHDEINQMKAFQVWDFPLQDAWSDDDMAVLAGVSQANDTPPDPGAVQGLLQVDPDDARSRLAARMIQGKSAKYDGDLLAVMVGNSTQVRLYVRAQPLTGGPPASSARWFDTAIPVTTVGVEQVARPDDGLPAATGKALADVRPGDRVRPVPWPIYQISAMQFNPKPENDHYEMVDVDIIKSHARLFIPLERIRAKKATWDIGTRHWELDDSAHLASLLDRPGGQGVGPALRPHDVNSAASPREIVLRHSSAQWMDYMSTTDLRRLGQTRGGGAADQARSIMHVRFTQPWINMILLLLGTPFVLTRLQGRLWEGILKCVLVAGACFVLSFVCQQISGDATRPYWAIIAAWLPVILFGPLAILMFDSVKT
ncbi:MAG: hypothetical protein BIFFINMI_01900 [Phycisphaerae bacterium]|nr:hypothetical protein [Phycisphaerae bacterium]